MMPPPVSALLMVKPSMRAPRLRLEVKAGCCRRAEASTRMPAPSSVQKLRRLGAAEADLLAGQQIDGAARDQALDQVAPVCSLSAGALTALMTVEPSPQPWSWTGFHITTISL